MQQTQAQDQSSFSCAQALVLEFNERSDPQPELARWLASHGVDIAHAWNIAGPLVELDIVIFPRARFDFAEAGHVGAVRAVVHVALADDAESPVDLVAWTRDRPDKIFRCLGAAAAIGIDQIILPRILVANICLFTEASSHGSFLAVRELSRSTTWRCGIILLGVCTN
jgi:hypothetical protein